MLEECWKEISGELRRLPNHEGRAVRVPRDYVVGCRILNQHVSLQKERWWRRLPHVLQQSLLITNTLHTHIYFSDLSLWNFNFFVFLFYTEPQSKRSLARILPTESNHHKKIAKMKTMLMKERRRRRRRRRCVWCN